ncbi:MAG: RimK family alpha-L-glutamate ligase [Bacteroidota bacterium]
MKRVGLLFGMENTFPGAVVAKINEMNAGVVAEFVDIGFTQMAEPTKYDVIIDRISHDIPYYRAYLKNAILGGTIVINNPFWWSADDKFFNYAMASKIGVAIPKTVLVPSHVHPPNTTSQSMRNLHFPLDWNAMFEYIGFPAFLKPHSGGGWKNVYKIHNKEDFFHFYHQTGDLVMTLQEGIEFEDYFRCYVIGQEKVHIMRYDPKQPHESRYVKDAPPIPAALEQRVIGDCLKICRALGYDLNTVEFAVRDGIPYAIDFLNPAPDADFYSVGAENFAWIVNAVAEFAIQKALSNERATADYRWDRFLNADVTEKSGGNGVGELTDAKSTKRGAKTPRK